MELQGRVREKMAPALRTPLSGTFGIDWPIFSVGFGDAAGPELAAAVSNAGGFGVLGASGMRPAHVQAVVERTRTLTERPFGINVIIADDPNSDIEEDRAFFRSQIEAAAAGGANAVVLFWGDPAPLVASSHE